MDIRNLPTSPGVRAANPHLFPMGATVAIRPKAIIEPQMALKPTATQKPVSNASNAEIDRPAQSSKPQPAIRYEPLGPEGRKGCDSKGFSGRTGVRVVSFRTRLIDPDNLCPKYFVDACRYSGIIRDDTAAEIEYSIHQEKVATKAEERTEISVTYFP